MNTLKNSFPIALSLMLLLNLSTGAIAQTKTTKIIYPLKLEEVKIDDAFWSPKLKVWTTKTVYDVFEKFEGKYELDRPDIIAENEKLGRKSNAMLNFDLVARGKKDIGSHDGPPWYDGLVYESIRGAADMMIEHPDAKLVTKIDSYIDRILAAQRIDPTGYINTYTTLTRSTQRWGTNGGDDNWQHDCYNAGMMVEAGIHYYKATGKTKLLDGAVKLSNYMYKEMGPLPKKNIVPGHGGPEEALLKLYWLFKSEPLLKSKLTSAVEVQHYFDLAKFWIENRGNHGNKVNSKRINYGAYNQDDKSVFAQKTIEGHAVRATLLAMGVAAVALENKDPRYVASANAYWDNMVGKKMFITGGEGAIPQDEKFGPNYFLPESAYLETCAAISSGFFSARMNELHADGKYMDELERVLYNNMLSGISLSGDKYYYENPLLGNGHKRWDWHGCPCCPPMILKMIGATPEYIYAKDANALYVNLFIGSEASTKLHGTELQVKQTTGYPWKGDVKLVVNMNKPSEFTMNIRIPGWARGVENPFGLYKSKVGAQVSLKVNGKAIPATTNKGYAAIKRNWKSGDVIELDIPIKPRLVYTNDAIETVRDKVALAAGPLVYGFELVDNPGLIDYRVIPTGSLLMKFEPGLLSGVNTIRGAAVDDKGQQVSFTAVPFYSLGNREAGSAYRVWMPQQL
ncbi:MAG: beta-L-arabinofuranosidase domain-containing protein [Bacteroidota bacterium]